MMLSGFAPSHRAYRVWIRHLVYYRSYFLAEWAGNLGEHFLWLLAFGYGLGRLVPSLDGLSYAQFIGPGIVVSIAMWTSSYESTYGVFSRMRIQNIYEAMLSAPLTIGDVVLGDLLWCATRALISSTLMIVVLTLFGLVGSPWAIAALPILFLEGLMFAGLGMMAATMAPSFSLFNFHFSIVVMPMFFFAGTMFPISGLPEWVQKISAFLPLTHAVQLVRGLIIYGKAESLVWHLSYLVLCTVVFLSAACYLVGRKLEV
ncbi:MAG: ABC transporter permease [bacterium]|nr:ABC transporter permease [bacterium]